VPIVLAGAFAVGFFLPFGFIFAKYKLSSKVTTRSLVEKKVNAQILGEVAKNEDKGIMAISAKSVSPTAEQLRLIRNNLKFITGKENKVMLVSSLMSKEGKTFISINLATTLSLVDKKVVIVDFDLRRPQISKSLGIKNANCLTDYLTHKITDWRQLINPSGVSDYLDIIGVNKIIANPAEIINSYKVSELIDHLKEEYDHIIIDTAPIGLVADSYAFSKIADLMIYVVRMNFTQISQLDQLNELVDNKIFKQNFLILNDIDKTSGRKFGYGYYGKEEKAAAQL
jgi:capsular exopolysaccharide synthesis family protein